MKNLPQKMPRYALFVYTICLLSPIAIVKAADPTFLDIDCANATTYAANSTYQTNLNTLLSVLSSNSTVSSGFYNFTAGSSRPDIAYGLFLCRGDISASACQDCVDYASKDVVNRCPRSKQVTIWYEECSLRYSNQSIFGNSDAAVARVLSNTQNVTNATLFREVLAKVMDDIAARASSDHLGKKFATGDSKYSPLQPVYGLAQCTPDLSDAGCNTCLRNCISSFDATKQGASVLFPSCTVRYEMYPFYDASVGAAPPPPSPVPPPPPPSTSTPSSPGNGGISSQVIIAIVVPIGVASMLFIVGFCFLTRRKKKTYNSLREDTVGDDISAVQSLQYDLGTIQAATNNFSDGNKIGEGGFGPVYKGLLPNGQEVAVKRLSRTSGQEITILPLLEPLRTSLSIVDCDASPLILSQT
ncbi:hypothetical protein Vadar_015086 [Vaccinium darrowii]|uniref:Uncharacterized protein n=1 Tax=Vaccinium darrowii TaxID=229202 RepID=A0ACB7XA24_9ERIC|nr:hypothetical protein Vadar_015086 [Vaccinium darrowii]